MAANINLAGTLNEAALIVPGAYVNVLAPPPGPISGTPTDIIGVVGTASWGPVGVPVSVTGYADGSVAFGPMQPRRYDLLSAIVAATLQGCSSFQGVRVTDGTDTAASAVVQTNCLTLTAKYTGSLGNGIVFSVGNGNKPNGNRLTISLPGAIPEVFDNIPGSGASFWANVVAAINSGQGVQRGPSNIVVATQGAGAAAPTLASYTLSGSADGATAITSAVLLGTDGPGRRGMYGLRGTGCAIGVLSDCADPTSWATQLAFGLSEQMQMVDSTAAGDTPGGFAATASATGVDSPWFKALLGDWVFLNDTVNQVQRLTAPSAWYAGRKAYGGPQNSALNKPIVGLVGTQSSAANKQYSALDLTGIINARGDVIASPSPGGAYFSCLTGHNSSSNNVTSDDAYTTLTDFLALSLAGPQGGGQFVGQLATPDQQREAQSVIAGLLQTLEDADMIQAYSVAVSVNANGVEIATVAVRYFQVVRFFVVNLTGGATVTVATTAAAAQAAASTLTA